VSLAISTSKFRVIAPILLIACALARAVAQQQISDQASLGELAREQRAERAHENLADVPLYTNDNLPASSTGLGEIGNTNSSTTAGAVNPLAAEERTAAQQKFAALRYELSEATKRYALHQQELTVLEQKLGQNNMQYYPDPNQTLTQEYSRSDINTLVTEMNQKKAQVASDQQLVGMLEREVQAAEARWGWLLAAEPSESSAPAEPPIGATPGTPAYYHAKLALLRQKLSLAKEEAKLAENQIKLLQVQQIRTLNANLQAELSGQISAKRTDLEAARQQVQQTNQLLDRVQQELQRAEALTQPSPQNPQSPPQP
jgi:hypothetical protein